MERCFPKSAHQIIYCKYHDLEWGVPSYDDRYLFEMLCLECMQAGLSFEIVLKKREALQQVFFDFDPYKVAQMTVEDIDELLKHPGIIRNKRKLLSILNNAKIFLEIQQKKGSFSSYLWAYTKNQPIVNYWKTLKEVPCFSDLSLTIAKDLKEQGMHFVGKKIIYSFLQAVGVIDDHLVDCPCKKRALDQELLDEKLS